MSEIKSFRDLIAWQKAMELADMAYEITDRFPPRERFGLAYQMRKAAVSIPSNIAEGKGHRRPSYVYFVTVASGSHGELDTQCELASSRRFVASQDEPRLRHLLDEVGRLARGLLRSLQ